MKNPRDADRLLSAFAPKKAQTFDIPEDPDWLPPGGSYVMPPLKILAEDLRKLSIEDFTLLEQQIGSRIARSMLLWSLKTCHPSEVSRSPSPKSVISLTALSEAIMPNGSEKSPQTPPQAPTSE